jgi:hypothetical protein
MYHFVKVLLIFGLSGFFCPFSAKAFSLLAHEAIIDKSWQKSIVPLLREKFPGVTEQQLKEAHAYAYGGSIVPDMGYFPFGSILFTNLVHYIRNGDFIRAMLEEARNVDEYAFALGVLCHYETDKYGHSLGTNKAVPLVYPRIKRKFGDIATYADNHASHIKMEFGFDVLQTARGSYDSKAYHDFIGFQVADSVLVRAFRKTYGLEPKDLFGNLGLTIGTFRWIVKNFIPSIVKTAWATRSNKIKKLNPKTTRQSFRYKMSKSEYYKEFGKEREHLNIFNDLFSVVLRILPKIGPLKVLGFKAPDLASEKLFDLSFDSALYHYNLILKEISEGNASLPNIDMDTGNKCVRGEYVLTDESYGTLLLKLKDHNFEGMTLPLKQNILAFYNEPDTGIVSKKEKRQMEDVNKALILLKNTSLN